jgi:hypothetical protein
VAGGLEQTKADSGRITFIEDYQAGPMHNLGIYHDNYNNCTIYVYYGNNMVVIPDSQLKEPKN